MIIDKASTDDTLAEATTVLKAMYTQAATHEATTTTTAVMSIPPMIEDRSMTVSLTLDEDHLVTGEAGGMAVVEVVVGAVEEDEVEVQT